MNVPTEKAKAVLDAMERDMFSQLVTRAEFNAEMNLVRQEFASGLGLLSRDIQAFKAESAYAMDRLESRLTIKLGSVGLALTVILFGMLKLT